MANRVISSVLTNCVQISASSPKALLDGIPDSKFSMSILCSGSGEFHIVRVLVRSRVLTVTDADLVYFGELVPNESLQHGAVLFTDTEINEEI